MSCTNLLLILAVKSGLVQEVEEKVDPKTKRPEIVRIVPKQETLARLRKSEEDSKK